MVQPDEFFGIFDAFLTAFMEARQDNDNFKKRQDEEEKRAKQEAEVSNEIRKIAANFDSKIHSQLKKRTIDRKNKEGFMSSVAKNLGLKSDSKTDTKGEFDDLISALRTGDVFGEDMAKFKRSRKTRLGGGGGGGGAKDTSNTSPPRQSLHREESRERPVVGRRQ